ncbi:hypothetical protein SMSP2_01776 [Limihaloglobus sulfuriphilus]|uniref:Uncharacterized protein n=1 Tax=Limihaloglobus sulfuriphilus TaxID=1851148 RepID=A0A1Q2MGK6_9BACT|nr:hypothetical protein SMSP2_01776 [Limihaloglobus sulfuriphilus]
MRNQEPRKSGENNNSAHGDPGKGSSDNIAKRVIPSSYEDFIMSRFVRVV